MNRHWTALHERTAQQLYGRWWLDEFPYDDEMRYQLARTLTFQLMLLRASARQIGVEVIAFYGAPLKRGVARLRRWVERLKDRAYTFLDVLAIKWLFRRHPLLGEAMWNWFKRTTDQLLASLKDAGFVPPEGDDDG